MDAMSFLAAAFTELLINETFERIKSALMKIDAYFKECHL